MGILDFLAAIIPPLAWLLAALIVFLLLRKLREPWPPSGGHMFQRQAEPLDSRLLRIINTTLLILGGAGLVLMTLPTLIELAKRVKEQIANF